MSQRFSKCRHVHLYDLPHKSLPQGSHPHPAVSGWAEGLRVCEHRRGICSGCKPQLQPGRLNSSVLKLIPASLWQTRVIVHSVFNAHNGGIGDVSLLYKDTRIYLNIL